MNTTQLKEKIAQGEFDGVFARLAYNDIDFQRERYISAVSEFEKIFGKREGVVLFSAPGRTELSGNHTDHQGGVVLAGSVNLDTVAVAVPRDDEKVTVASFGYEPFVVDLKNLNISDAEKGKSQSLVRGVAKKVSEAPSCSALRGFDAYTTSLVPKGSGLSSSAAFEILIGKMLSYFCTGDSLSDEFLASAGHFAEYNYFGKPCGKMDQYACAMGGIVYIDFKNDTPMYRKIDVDFEKMGYTLFITSAGGSHAHLTPEYTSITEEMREVAEFFGKKRLSDVDFDVFKKSVRKLRGKVCDRALTRALHYFTEVERVSCQLRTLEEKDIGTYLEFMRESGDSSLLNLQNIYPSSDINERTLSLALGFSKTFGAVSRVHGGGFAGTIQALVKNSDADLYMREMSGIFGDGNVVKISIRPVGAYVLTEGK